MISAPPRLVAMRKNNNLATRRNRNLDNEKKKKIDDRLFAVISFNINSEKTSRLFDILAASGLSSDIVFVKDLLDHPSVLEVMKTLAEPSSSTSTMPESETPPLSAATSREEMPTDSTEECEFSPVHIVHDEDDDDVEVLAANTEIAPEAQEEDSAALQRVKDAEDVLGLPRLMEIALSKMDLDKVLEEEMEHHSEQIDALAHDYKNKIRCRLCDRWLEKPDPAKNANRFGHLMVHAKNHSQKKQFSCPVCSYSHSRKFHINKHIQTVHGLEDELPIDHKDELEEEWDTITKNCFPFVSDRMDLMKIKKDREATRQKRKRAPNKNIGKRGCATSDQLNLDDYLDTKMAYQHDQYDILIDNAVKRMRYLSDSDLSSKDENAHTVEEYEPEGVDAAIVINDVEEEDDNQMINTDLDGEPTEEHILTSMPSSDPTSTSNEIHEAVVTSDPDATAVPDRLQPELRPITPESDNRDIVAIWGF